MAKINPLVAAVAALIPLVLGMVWYSSKVFGNAWMAGAGLTPEDAKTKMNMPLVFGLTYVYSFLIAVSLHFTTIHQFGFDALLIPEMNHPVSEQAIATAKSLYADFGTSFRTARHGAIHGTITGIFFVLPIIAIGGLFEFRGWKYILISAGYWIVSCALMGAVICQFA
ncbi:MAG: DUF1761 domain-containing protein [Bacteroidetes bacterium]|nr:DUF1761 domain-containing protein [Bacteroidota bacterium]